MKQDAWWTQSAQEVCQKLDTNLQCGLSSDQVKAHLQQYGFNRLPSKKAISALEIFANQFKNFIVVVLLIASLIAIFLGEWADSVAILVIIILNAILGFVQEFHAEKSLLALKELVQPTAQVLRDGQKSLVDTCELVPGDVVFLSAGDRVPADGRIIESAQCRVQEASLTGESQSILKDCAVLDSKNQSLGERKNMLFMATTAVSGRAMFVVTETGIRTEIGKIAKLLETEKEDATPLQKKLASLGKKLVLICIAIVTLVFVFGLLRGNPWLEMLMTALSLAVAAIPEGLPAVVTIALALGVKRMVKRQAIMRKLASVETLGCATVICSDKTGTLTRNEMTVERIWIMDQEIEVTGESLSPQGKFLYEQKKIQPAENKILREVLQIGLLVNDATLQKEISGAYKMLGDPTEGALLVAGLKAGFEKEPLVASRKIVAEFPFDSERKRMSVIRDEDGVRKLFAKGAPDVLLRLCDKVLTEKGEETLSDSSREIILKENLRLASQAYRVLAVATKKIEAYNQEDACACEQGLTFVGLVAMMDPPRTEVLDAIQKAHDAGIKTVMITGDHKETAMAIAGRLGMLDTQSQALSGPELDEMNDADLRAQVRNTTVYARMSAEHKLRVVKAWKSHGDIVAMTGDGVNDAPAVKVADIGIAMGITGTDVTKEAADMVIADDCFTSIVNAVEEGRAIFDNITKFVSYLLFTNIAEILVLFLAILIGLEDNTGRALIPLLPIQILWLNLVTDGFPAIALGVDPVAQGTMKREPRDPSATILSRRVGMRVLVMGMIITIAALAGCFWGRRESVELAQTMTLTMLVGAQMICAHLVRVEYGLRLTQNKWLLLALVGSFGLQVLILYTPIFQRVFGVVPLNLIDWGFFTLGLLFVAILGHTFLRRTSKI